MQNAKIQLFITPSSRDFFSRENALTLMEMAIVVVIIAILAAIAYPCYIKARERTIDEEAKLNLTLIQAAERAYRIENRSSYYPPSGLENDITNINNNLRLELNEINFDYDITGGASTFTATAVRDAGAYNRTWQITQANSSLSCSGACP